MEPSPFAKGLVTVVLVSTPILQITEGLSGGLNDQAPTTREVQLHCARFAWTPQTKLSCCAKLPAGLSE